MYSLSWFVTAWWWPYLGAETLCRWIYISIKVCWLWLEILIDLCEWYANEDVPHKALPDRWYRLQDCTHCSEVGFQAVKNARQISLPWHFPHSDVAQREADSAWIFRSLRMRLIGFCRNVENRLSSDATSYHRIAELYTRRLKRTSFIHFCDDHHI